MPGVGITAYEKVRHITDDDEASESSSKMINDCACDWLLWQRAVGFFPSSASSSSTAKTPKDLSIFTTIAQTTLQPRLATITCRRNAAAGSGRLPPRHFDAASIGLAKLSETFPCWIIIKVKAVLCLLGFSRGHPYLTCTANV